MTGVSLQKGQTAVITGAGSGFGLEFARLGAQRGMNLVLTDVQADALDKAVSELTAQGAKVVAMRESYQTLRPSELHQASSSRTTSPCTSVSRKSRPA